MAPFNERAHGATMVSRKRRFVIAAIAVSVAVAALIVLLVVPVPQHFSMHGAAIYDPNTSCAVGYPNTIDTTAGTSVNFHWSAP